MTTLKATPFALGVAELCYGADKALSTARDKVRVRFPRVTQRGAARAELLPAFITKYGAEGTFNAEGVATGFAMSMGKGTKSTMAAAKALSRLLASVYGSKSKGESNKKFDAATTVKRLAGNHTAGELRKIAAELNQYIKGL